MTSSPLERLLVREWALNPPGWCEVRAVCSAAESALNELDPGERDAIQLALETGINTLLIDDSKGRREALHRHLRVTGTIAVLEKAAQRGLTDFRAALQRLELTNFRLSASIRDAFLKRNR
jgi:predicted nucleic acid-binding protein